MNKNKFFSKYLVKILDYMNFFTNILLKYSFLQIFDYFHKYMYANKRIR